MPYRFDVFSERLALYMFDLRNVTFNRFDCLCHVHNHEFPRLLLLFNKIMLMGNICFINIVTNYFVVGMSKMYLLETAKLLIGLGRCFLPAKYSWELF